MKISLNWLKEYIKYDLPAEKISEILTDIGLEVESLERVESVRGGLQGVVVGHVLTCEKHPDADKLSVTTVDIGDGTPVQIVCGAPNVAAGQKVVVATVNCTLYPTGEQEGFKIKKSKIRGVESLGMLCAEDELGLGQGHEGILELPKEVKAGTTASEYFNIKDDYIIEIGLTPNRIDASSHYGVARDLAVYLKVNNIDHQLSLPSVEEFKQQSNSCPIEVEVQSAEAAPRYMGVTISGVKIAPSPEWLQMRLRAIGMTPKNNVVDITNFVLHEVGQPLHAFDVAKIKGGKVVVRTCPEGTPFVTLDCVERKLNGADLMICNAEEPMCIAGVFGGLDSGVSDQTTDIFLESAWFNAVWVRKTARRHGFNTDASFRYERGTDPNMPPYALMRAALLIKELAGGEISSAVTDIYPMKAEPFRFEVSIPRMIKLIGKDIPAQQLKAIIEALEVVIEKQTEEGLLSVAVPQYRVDVRREADLLEDILRIYGYNNIEIPLHVNSTITYAPTPDREKIKNTISDMLTSNGFNEIMSNSLTKFSYYKDLEVYPESRCVKMLNPLSQDLNVMRQTLLFNAMEAAELNSHRRRNDIKFYEFGNCYQYNGDKAQEGGLAPYSEKLMLGVLISGQDHQQSWNESAKPTNFFTLKAVMEKILLRLGANPYSAKIETLENELYQEAITVSINGKKMVELGVVSKKISTKFDIKEKAYFMEADFGALAKISARVKIAVEELSKFPEVKRDLALLVDSNVTFSQLSAIAFGAEKKLLKNVSLFDVYQGDKLPAGKKSYALSFILEDKTKTLVDNVIDKTMSTFIREFERQAGAQIR